MNLFLGSSFYLFIFLFSYFWDRIWLPMYSRLTSSLWSFYFSLPRAEVAEVYHHTHPWEQLYNPLRERAPRFLRGLISLVGFPYVSDQCWVLTWLASTQRRVGGFIEIHPSLQTPRWRRPEKEWVFFGSLDSAALSFYIGCVRDRYWLWWLGQAGMFPGSSR